MKYQQKGFYKNVLFCLILLFLELMGATITNAKTYEFVAKWGSYGSGDGQFNSLGYVAVDSSGNVYVADALENHIQKFDSSGIFITKWGSKGSADGQFNCPRYVSVDSSGNVYVGDTLNYRIQKFAKEEKIIPIITWNNPVDITYGVTLSSTQLNAVAKEPITGNTITGTYVYTPPAGTVLGAGSGQTLHVDFTPDDTANYTTTSADVTINVSQAIPTITWSNPANIVYGTPLSNTQLNAVASVLGTYVYTPAAGTILNVGMKTLHVDFIPTDTVNYTTASKDVTINVTAPLIPVANFSATPTSGTVPLNVAFTDASVGTPTSWKWDFGDGKSSTQKNPTEVYKKPGTYTVSLTVKDGFGTNTTIKTGYITVS